MEQICPYFNRCGGCLYQDIPFEQYLERKQAFVLRAFSDFDITPNLQPIITVPIGSRRRACFAFYKGHLGFNERKSHTIVDINTCKMLTPTLNEIIEPLRVLVKKLKGTGDIFLLDTPYGIDMHIKMGKEKPNLELLELLASFGNTYNIARLLFNNEPILQKMVLPFPANVFLQPSVFGEETLVRLMLEEVSTAKSAVDLFCGTGTFTKPLIKAGLKVMGYDSETASIAALGTHGSVRDLFRNPLMPLEFDGIDLVIIDPPRSGAKAQVENLVQTAVGKIIMISCNPSTCARESKLLIENGWRLDKVTPVDQFTYSNHIELVCVFSKQADCF